jgi:A/G-specific adenine glycosylase
MQKFSETLIEWYKINKRDLPWRNTNNPYHIWLSEVILQQTRVAQGLPYYLKFIESFPTVIDLANAHQDEVLRLWQGLGYYSRGRNLHFTAQLIINNFEGIFPTKFDELIKFKGVGNYTASAIASFCSNEPKAVVDGNVYRVLARYFGIESDISLTSTQKEFQKLAFDLLNKKKPGIHNQAIMEFGALQCVPKSPNCVVCPLQNSCDALKNKKVASLPFKSKKIKTRKRFFNYIVIDRNNSTFVRRRNQGDIWEGLYEFPLIETSKDLDEKSILNSNEFQILIGGKNFEIIKISPQFKHQLTHQTIYCRFIELKVKNFTNETDFENVKWTALEKYPKPILIQRFYSLK